MISTKYLMKHEYVCKMLKNVKLVRDKIFYVIQKHLDEIVSDLLQLN